jgi:hypothetical protein
MNITTWIKVKHTFMAATLIAVTALATWATMTIQDLRADTAVLEDRLEELQAHKATLEAVQAGLQEENQVLENHPLR